MATYILLAKFTDQGIRSVNDTSQQQPFITHPILRARAKITDTVKYAG